MKYSFKDIYNEEMYNSSRVVFVTGKYNIFNNLVMDEFKDRCKGKSIEKIDDEILAEFNLDDAESVEISNKLDIDNFIQMVNMPNINGKWFTCADLTRLTKKQSEWLKDYMKNPSENGVIVIYSLEFKDYRLLLRNNLINGSKTVNLIQLNFPNKQALANVVINKFKEKNCTLDERAIDLFIVRMSKSYDDYDSVIEKVCLNARDDDQIEDDDIVNISYDQIFDSLKGVENFVIEDFLYRITVPLTTDKASAKNPVYKMIGYLVDEYGSRRLVNTLKIKIDELIQFRMAINDGYIPIIVNYDVNESKKLLGEESPLFNKSDYQFKEMARLASRTSLQDWVYMKLILDNVEYKFDENSYFKVLYSLITRSTLTESRLNNDIGIDSFYNDDLNYINNIMYTDT